MLGQSVAFWTSVLQWKPDMFVGLYCLYLSVSGLLYYVMCIYYGDCTITTGFMFMFVQTVKFHTLFNLKLPLLQVHSYELPSL
jgi:hypothetical protein